MLFEWSILAAFVAMICWGIGDFFIQKNVRHIGDVDALAFIGIFGAVGLLPFVWGDFTSLFDLRNILILVVLGVVTFVAAILQFEALKEGKLSVIDVILEFELPVTIILGFIFFSERLSTAQIFAIVILFFGILMMSVRKTDLVARHHALEKGVWLAIFASIGMGIVNFLTAASSKSISPLMAIWVPWIIFGAISIFFSLKRSGLKKFVNHAKQHKLIVLGMVVFDTSAWLFYAIAVLKNEIAITTAITESYPALAMILGIWLNKEKIEKHQFVGALIAILVSIYLAFSA